MRGCSWALTRSAATPARARAFATPATWATDPPTLAPKLDRGFAQLDFSQPAERLLRRIRAATPRPGVDIELVRAAKRMRIVRAKLGPEHAGRARPGALRVEAGRLLLAASDAYLELEQIQLAGKRPMRADELLRGFRVPDAEEARTP